MVNSQTWFRSTLAEGFYEKIVLKYFVKNSQYGVEAGKMESF